MRKVYAGTCFVGYLPHSDDFLSQPIEEFELNDDEKDKKKVTTDLKLLTGGKGTGSGSADWLSPLPETSVFLCKDVMQDNFVLLRLEVAHKYERAIFLYENLMDKPFGIVDPVRFCRRFTHVETLHEPTNQEKEQDGQSDRTEPDSGATP